MHEISSWINERACEFDEEILRQISLELKAIKLVQGKCLVCDHNRVADSSFENILKIMEKNNISLKIRNEFLQLFGICV